MASSSSAAAVTSTIGSVVPPRWAPRLQRGRAVAASFVIAYFTTLFGLGGYWQWSKLMPVGAGGVSLQDFRDLTSAWDCARRGIPVLPTNPCDPIRGAAANWPRLWLLPYHLGLGQSSTVPLAIVAIISFFSVAILVLPADASAVAGAIYGFAVCSPAVMLGSYWGNIDIIVFVLVGAAALLFARQRSGLIVGEAILLLAALLKLFPVVAASALVRRGTRAAKIGAIAIVACVATYVLADYGYIALALRRTAQSDSMSFGIRRFTEWLVAGVNTLDPRVAAGVNQHLTPRAWDVGVAAIVLLVLLARRQTLRKHLPHSEERHAQRDLDLFWTGASIYICSYVAFRSWDYRLAFTLLTVPQVLRWAMAKRALAITTLLALLVTLWIELPPPILGSSFNTLSTPWTKLTRMAPFNQPLPLGAFAQLVLFCGLLSGVVATFPSSAERLLIYIRESGANGGRRRVADDSSASGGPEPGT